MSVVGRPPQRSHSAPTGDINTALKRLERGDFRYRFVIDMSHLALS